MKAEREYLICARADQPRVVPGSVFNHSCKLCRYRVMIAPSGQKLLRRKPRLVILCGPCAEQRVEKGDSLTLGEMDWNEIGREVHTAMPNFWKKRN